MKANLRENSLQLVLSREDVAEKVGVQSLCRLRIIEIIILALDISCVERQGGLNMVNVGEAVERTSFNWHRNTTLFP